MSEQTDNKYVTNNGEIPNHDPAAVQVGSWMEGGQTLFTQAQAQQASEATVRARVYAEQFGLPATMVERAEAEAIGRVAAAQVLKR